MEMHQLQYFVAVADLGSFTKAADRCLIAQPSLSQQIIKLEKELRQRLFERLPRNIRLTDAGRTLYSQAVSILASVEEARQRVMEVSEEESGTITLGAIPTVAPYLLPPMISAFQKGFPRASVIIHEAVTRQTIENCLQGDLDVGILALPINESRLHAEPLMEEELLLALPVHHRLARKRRLTMDDLHGEAFILMDEMHCLGQQVLALCSKNSCRPRVTCRSAQLLTVQELVSEGHGVSLVPAMACRTRSSRHRYRRLTGVRPTRTIAAVWHRQRYQRPIQRRLIEFMREYALRYADSVSTAQLINP